MGGAEGEEEEPHWAEVVVGILLSLLSQPSRHIRQVCKTVFTDICPHVTARALNAILDVGGSCTLGHEGGNEREILSMLDIFIGR